MLGCLSRWPVAQPTVLIAGVRNNGVMRDVAVSPLTEIKRAQSAQPIHELLATRYSPRVFAARPVEEAKLQSLFEAARWAASSSNQQPWRFIVTRRGTEAFTRLVACLRPGNQRWAPAAPVLILSVAKTQLEPSGDKPARENAYAWHDLGLAVGNLSVQATALGLALHQMGGFDKEAAREAFGIPDGYAPVSVIALGYPGDPASLPEDLRARELAPRTRKPLEELVFEGDFGKPLRWG
jgi:nitroreductase